MPLRAAYVRIAVGLVLMLPSTVRAQSAPTVSGEPQWRSALFKRTGEKGRPLFAPASAGGGSETASQGNLNVGGAGNFLGNVYMYGTLDLGSLGTNPNVRLNVGGPSAGTTIETAPVVQLSRPAVSGVKNTNSAGFFVGAFEPGILGRTRIDLKLSGLPTDSNTYGTIPDVTVMTMLADGRVGIGTTDPVSKLEVSGGNVAVTNGSIAVTNGSVAVTNGDVAISNGTLKVPGAGANTATSVFVHVVSLPAGGCTTASIIDNPYTNNYPNAILLVTQSAISMDTPIASGPYYARYGDQGIGCALLGGLNKWMIYTTSGSLPNGARFNVMVIKP